MSDTAPVTEKEIPEALDAFLADDACPAVIGPVDEGCYDSEDLRGDWLEVLSLVLSDPKARETLAPLIGHGDCVPRRQYQRAVKAASEAGDSFLKEALERAELVEARERLVLERAERAEAELAGVKAERDMARATVSAYMDKWDLDVKRAERAEAAIRRVEALCDESLSGDYDWFTVDEIRAALATQEGERT